MTSTTPETSTVQGAGNAGAVPDVGAAVQYAAWRAGQVPPTEQVAAGLWSIPVPMPGSLRYTLIYALELAGGVALVDAGWPDEAAWQALTGGLALAGYRVADVRGVLVTHAHPDHLGLARRIRDASGAWIALHPADAAAPPGPAGADRDGADRDGADRRLAELGMPGPPPAQDATPRRTGRLAAGRLGDPDLLLEHGSRPDLPGWDLRTVWTPGHSAGHLCFHDPGRGLLFAGDHLLPRVSPQVSARPGGTGDPLGAYLRSLRLVGALGEVRVLPAHEYRFAGLPGRAGQLAAHHHRRLAEIAGLLAGAPWLTCWEVTQAVSWARPLGGAPWRHQRKAVSETLAHLVHLKEAGLARHTEGPPRRWAPAGPACAAGYPAGCTPAG
jgi:glyoxylase-like metal-dependent hydrolase (beta-lactamase superfamily II)